ncbi:hypothetical protein [Bradyrhizobium sp. sBnM-33]|uniref:hypothetical protein n=1 Tax=Bradyrhizobium sp. sBnM-33 TaxID=2831780 RepID=UPI001BCCBB08|nr:hypothetical protein [Bradyrhizobium sp. sBnM-33]WOH53751.1 hypothetical protein RX328_17670 [Bradyrhizobium sp. sBnM-33]
MINRLSTVLIPVAIGLFAPSANADQPKEIKTESGKAVVLGNFLNAPANCATNPGPIPLPRLREKPSHGVVGLQIVVADVAATDACPARKVPSIALFYTPSKDFVGKDSIQVEFETGDNKLPALSFLVTVQAPAK